MTKSQLNIAPHLPVPIDSDQRNPLPSYHVSTSLARSRVPLRAQNVTLRPTGISPVPLKSIPTRPIEVQPISPVSFPGNPQRLPSFTPKTRTSKPGNWDQIRIASPALTPEEQMEDAWISDESHEEMHDGFSGGEHARRDEAGAQGAWNDPVPFKEQVGLPMERVPMMRLSPMGVATKPVRTQTAAIRRPKKSHRPKKSSSARIW